MRDGALAFVSNRPAPAARAGAGTFTSLERAAGSAHRNQLRWAAPARRRRPCNATDVARAQHATRTRARGQMACTSRQSYLPRTDTIPFSFSPEYSRFIPSSSRSSRILYLLFIDHIIDLLKSTAATRLFFLGFCATSTCVCLVWYCST